MPRPTTKPDQMPTFTSAAEKRAWLLAQLEEVEREAVLEDMTRGKNERITIQAADMRIEIGNAALCDGGDAGEFAQMLGRVIDALPLGTAFVVEAGRGGKVLGGGTSGDEGLVRETGAVAPKTSQRVRKPKPSAA